jgi:hypothetical protein
MTYIETPNVPLNVWVSSVHLSAPCTLSVSWDAPDNSKKFDLDHFKVHIMLPELESYIANGTSMEPAYHFRSDNAMVPPQNSIHVTIAAVSKCGLSGPPTVDLNPEINDETMFINVHDVVSTTESGPEEFKHNLLMVNGKQKII